MNLCLLKVFLPHLQWPCSVRQALTFGCDLSSVPRKSVLRLLAEHCLDPGEKRKLLYICSRNGREAYRKCMLEGNPGLLAILKRQEIEWKLWSDACLLVGNHLGMVVSVLGHDLLNGSSVAIMLREANRKAKWLQALSSCCFESHLGLVSIC